jgi:citrate lyase synthetase
MSQTEDKMPKKTKVQKPTKTKSMLGGATAKVEVHPTLNKAPKGARFTNIHEAVVIFGRMNPPTVGHQRLVEDAVAVAEAHSQGDPQSEAFLFLSKTVNENNPLSYARRIELAKEAFGDSIVVVEEDEVTDYLSLIKYVAEHVDHATFFVGTDRFADVNRILTDYNGTEFVLESYSVQLVDRDPDSTKLEESVSATKLRTLAEEANLEEFTMGLPEKIRSRADEIMEWVQEGIQRQRYLKEEKGLRKVAKSVIINRAG